MQKWKTIASNYIYQTPFGNLRKETCELPNGKVIEDYYVHEYPNWVNAIVITTKGQIVLVNQYRHAARDFFLEIPAGKAERGESQQQAIVREVKEETGMTSSSEPILLSESKVNPAIQDNTVTTYLITGAMTTSEQFLDDTEEIDINLFNFDEVENMIHAGAITQLFTVKAFFMATYYLETNKLNLRR
ncbi:NUDIX hydrolase [Tuberibacillus sp. Marseille-P3662]|uniref:NUDIX hydrolase n=1 Tax=Tuberibacillus sp. Marseille-P3662 TaxID=1965358 RepID=UPI000A1C96D0|nr:NUDIX hydrolase [Tuberibacillus sp. Marseille-P3662]